MNPCNLTLFRGRSGAARPRAVHADFHHDECSGMPTAQREETPAIVGDGFLFDDLALGVQHAHSVLAIAEVESNGEK